MAPQLALLDTDTLSEIMKGKNASIEQHAREYLKKYGRFRFSVITRYEILRGLKAKKAVRQIANFEDRCNRSYLYPVTNEIVQQASDIYAHLHQKEHLTSFFITHSPPKSFSTISGPTFLHSPWAGIYMTQLSFLCLPL